MKKGALREYVSRRFGKSGFTQAGDIKVSVLDQLKKAKSTAIRKRAVFALNMRRKK